MIFYSKLSKELKKQFKTSDIPIPDIRAKCITIAQQVWEGLYGPSDQRSSKNNTSSKDNTSKYTSRYPCHGLSRDRKNQYYLGHYSRDNQNKDKPKNKYTTPKPKKKSTYFICYKPSYYASSYPNQKKPSNKKAKI